MPPRANDPFDFAEQFASMGATGLVKKPMVDLRGNRTSGSGTGAGAGVGTGSLTAKAGARATATKPSSPPRSTLPAATCAAATPRPAVPPPPPCAPATTHDIGLDDFFGGRPPVPNTVAPSSAASTTAASSADPFAAFGDVDGAAAPIESVFVAAQPRASVSGSGMPTPSSSYSNFLNAEGGLSPQQTPAAAPAAPRSPTTPAEHASEPQPPPYSSVMADASRPGSQADISGPPPVSSGGRSHAYEGGGGGSGRHQRHAGADSRGRALGAASGDDDDGYRFGQARVGGGASARPSVSSVAAAAQGFLSHWSKKAVAAAHLAAEQINEALKDADAQQHSGTHARAWAGSPAQAPQLPSARRRSGDGYAVAADSPSSPGGHRTLWGDGGGHSGDGHGTSHVLDVAMRLQELPQELHGEALANLPDGLRQQVEQLLAEHAAAGMTRTADSINGREGSGDVAAAMAGGGAGHAAGGGNDAGVGGGLIDVDDEDVPPARPAAPPAAAVDLLGEGDDADLLSTGGGGGGNGGGSGGAAAPCAPLAAFEEASELDDSFFSGGAPGTASAAAANTDPSTMGDFFGGGGGGGGVAAGAAGSTADLMADLHSFGLDDVNMAAHEHLYKDAGGEAGEPELRRRLRAARLAEQHAKMRGALAQKQAMDDAEAAAKREQVALKDANKSKVLAWSNRHKGNIRGLLGSLQTVLWEGSTWEPVSMADLLDAAQVKKVYRRANLLVHPDKVRQRNGGPEQVAIADLVFDVLKEAWTAFQ